MSDQLVHISFTKGIDKPSSAVIKRNDQTEVFVQYRANMVFHDLAHFAIESSLMQKVGFFWLVNLGLQPSDFELAKDQRPALLNVALTNPDHIAIEFLANQLMVETLNSGPIENFLTVLKQGMQTSEARNHTLPLTDTLIQDIRELYNNIVEGWSDMKDGQEKKMIVFYPDKDDRPESV